MMPEPSISRFCSPAHGQCGLIYIEYVLATLVLVVFLFLPVPGTEHSVVAFVLQGMRGFYQNTHYLMALP